MIFHGMEILKGLEGTTPDPSEFFFRSSPYVRCLPQAVLKTWKSSESLSAVASWQRARENCHREVQEIIDECRSQGKQYTDPDFNPVEDEAKARREK